MMFPGSLDQPPWKHHRDKTGDVSRVAGSATLETLQGQGEAKKEGRAGQVMFPGWLGQPPWNQHRNKARQRRKEGQGR